MKIVHIATSLKGGAGIASRRIAQAQYDAGFEVKLLAGNGDSEGLMPHETLLTQKELLKLKSKSITFLQSKFVQNSDLLQTPISVSSGVLSFNEIQKADIIHMHAFYNFVRVQEIFELSRSKKIVITIHDERLFTGGCHYSFNCNGFMKDCSKCPQVNTLFSGLPKRELAANIASKPNISNMQIISPSKWLANLAKESSLLRGLNISIIENPVDPIFSSNSSHYKTRNEEKIKLGFISANLNNPYKGLNLLVEALDETELCSKYELRLFGKGNVSNLPIALDVTQDSYDDSASAARAMKDCDAIIVPSLQDNFPSVVIEALMSGTPVIGSDSGGIPEVLNSFNLPVFKAGDLISLRKTLLDFQKIEFTEEQLIEIQKRFSFATSSAAHARIYEKLIN